MNATSENSESPDLSGVRILVVEDSWQVATAIACLLRELGAEVSGPVATSADAQRLVDERPPDAALVDFNLRGGEVADGLIERLRQLAIYVIVSTGYTELPSVRRHAVPILHKPVTETALLSSLRPVVARRGGVPAGSPPIAVSDPVLERLTTRRRALRVLRLEPLRRADARTGSRPRPATCNRHHRARCCRRRCGEAGDHYNSRRFLYGRRPGRPRPGFELEPRWRQSHRRCYLSSTVMAKRLELLHEIAPRADAFAVLIGAERCPCTQQEHSHRARQCAERA